MAAAFQTAEILTLSPNDALRSSGRKLARSRSELYPTDSPHGGVARWMRSPRELFVLVVGEPSWAKRATGAPAGAERGEGAPRATAQGGPGDEVPRSGGRSPPVQQDDARLRNQALQPGARAARIYRASAPLFRRASLSARNRNPDGSTLRQDRRALFQHLKRARLVLLTPRCCGGGGGTSAPRRRGLRAEKFASGDGLTMPASARVGRTAVPNRFGSRVCRCAPDETAPPRSGAPAAHFSN
jgi:hypothetical protein